MDTTLEYMQGLKKLSIKTLNFEDLGEGSKIADLVINAIYPEKQIIKNHYFGHDYFILRDEFIYSETKDNKEKID